MKVIKYLFSLGLLTAGFVSCTKDNYNDVSFVKSTSLAAKLSLLFDITQDNTGLVTITPNGEGGVSYAIYFGDGSVAPATVLAGQNTKHVYKEGIYDVKVIATNIAGKTTEAIQKLTVSFKAPENLVVKASIEPTNSYQLNVGATANFETLFKVYFGDVVNETPQSFLEGATISHTYASVGTYTVRVVALSGGAAFKDSIFTIKIAEPVLLPLTFESSTVNYAFNNFDGGGVTVVNNPASSVANPSAKVAKMVKSAGQTWGGSAIALSSPIDFSANKIFKMKVYSPRVGAKVLLKVESATGNFEQEVATTKAAAWEDLSFDYSTINTVNAYTNLVIIFDNGTMGNGLSNFTFYFDDIRLTNSLSPGTGKMALPVTFDDPAINYTVIDFGNASTVDATDPKNANNKVKKTTKPTGAETWAGTSVGAYFPTRIPLTASATQMSIKVYSPAAGLKVRLKIEDHTDVTKSVETEAITTVANSWETLVFDFKNQATGTAALNLAYNFDMASVFFDFNVVGNGKVFYWDDVTFTGSNVPPPPPPTNGLSLPLNFELSAGSYAFTDFDGGVVTVIGNPQNNSGNTSAQVGKMVKNAGNTWGGSYIALGSPIDFSTKKTFKMKVYSPKVGAKVLLKVENLTDASVGFEKEVATTIKDGWETLTFDYSTVPTNKSYQKIVLIFENGTMGNGSASFTYLFDDITLN